MNDLQQKLDPGTVLRIDFRGGLLRRGGPIWLQVLEPPDEATRHHEADGKFSLLYPLAEGEGPGPCPSVECAGRIWRRAPFLLYGVLFWRDAARAEKIEVLGTAALPPESFRLGSRSPTEAVDFESGAGPWHVSDADGSRIVTWLSPALAQLPYAIVAYWWHLRDAWRFQGRYESLREVNERAVAYGRKMARRGESPADIVNPARDDPPWPEVSAREAALRVGEVIEVPTANGLAYCQVTPWEGTFGKLLRVFEGYWPTAPEALSPALFRTKFLICVPFVRGLIEDGICRKVGKMALADDTGEQPVTRGEIVLEGGWYRTRIVRPKASPVIAWTRLLRDMVGQRFMPEHASLSNGTTGYAPETLIERLDLDWRPEADLWVQVALAHNQKKLGRSGPGFFRQAKARIGAGPRQSARWKASSEEPPAEPNARSRSRIARSP